MTLETMYFVSQIGASLLLFASIVFLIFQVRDGNKQLRSQGYFNFIDLGSRPLEMLIENPDLAELLRSAHSDPHSVNGHDWDRCQAYLFMQINSWEYCYYQHKAQALQKELWVGADTWFREIVIPEGAYTRFWSEYADAYDEPFRSHAQSAFDALASKVS